MSTYYCCPIEAVMRSLLPQVIRRAEEVLRAVEERAKAGMADHADVLEASGRGKRKGDLIGAILRRPPAGAPSRSSATPTPARRR